MWSKALQTLPETFSTQPCQPTDSGGYFSTTSERSGSLCGCQYLSLTKKEIAADFLVVWSSSLLPFRTHKYGYHPTDDDYISILNILRYSRYSAQFVVHRYFESVESLNRLISALDLMIGMRLHSLILAAVRCTQRRSTIQKFADLWKRLGSLNFHLDSLLIKRDYSLSENILGDPATARRHVQSGVSITVNAWQSALAQILAKMKWTCNFVFRMDRVTS